MDPRNLKFQLASLRLNGEIVAFHRLSDTDEPRFSVAVVGDPSQEVKKLEDEKKIKITKTLKEDEVFYFLGSELRPGTGVIRREGGRNAGPSGTLTCFLASRDSQDVYFSTASHVATNFWTLDVPDIEGSVYLSRKGYPGTNTSSALGELAHTSKRPKLLRPTAALSASDMPGVDLDVSVVKLRSGFEIKQRTTCFGNFGEWPDRPVDSRREDEVMKCGAEETHWTEAKVFEVKKTVYVYGPNLKVYILRGQTILESLPSDLKASCWEPVKRIPDNREDTPFAVAGDSGTLVVDKKTKQPVGMLIAGSVLDGRYVMTPISALWDYWCQKKFIVLRA